MRHGRGHQHDIVAAETHGLRIRKNVRKERVRRVHHALGLARRAGGVEQLRHVVGAWAIAREDGFGITRFFPARAAQKRLETVARRLAAVSCAHDYHVLQGG